MTPRLPPEVCDIIQSYLSVPKYIKEIPWGYLTLLRQQHRILTQLQMYYHC